MSWIKRNLFFVIGAAVAVVLLGLAGWYLYSEWNLNNDNSSKLAAAYAELTRISSKPQNPGNEKTDNIKNAREYTAKVREVINKAHNYFQPIPPLPPGINVSSEAFAAALRRTVDELTRSAANSSVTLQPKYDFSFAAQRPLVKFAGSLDPLAAELGEVKAVCDVLFKAKVNTLYNLRRVRVSPDDLSGPQSDYLENSPVTNDLAVLVPYEVTFYGFSAELAGVLAGFANEPHGFIVTTVNVEPGVPSSASADAPPMTMAEGAYTPPSSRYSRYGNPAAYAAPPVAPVATPATGMGGSPVMLDEKQLKVTMGVSVVKLLPKK